MMQRKNVVGGLALVAVGAAATVAASHVHIHWGPTAQAAPAVVAEVKPALPPPSDKQLSEARVISRTFAQVASQLSPSVVRISITKGGSSRRTMNRRGGNPFEGTPFERFFGDDSPFGGDEGNGPKQKGLGSGVVIDKKGYILTNNHVVEDADDVKVSFVDGKTVSGKVVGTDPRSDLAVVKVDGVDVTPAKMGDSDRLQVGDWLIAIGNPFGLDHTVTVGVLSAKNRAVQGGNHFEDFLQTDASINPGNSGGPLVNLDGEVIGINTMIAGIGTGIGFAVPSSMFKPVAEQLINGGKVRRPYIGIRMQDVSPEISRTLGKGAPDRGALVGQVENGSPAEKAGVKAGDIITDVNGQKTTDTRSVQRNIVNGKIGQKVDLTVWRDGKSTHLAATTAELPGDDRRASREGGGGGDERASKAKLGIGLSALTPNLAQQLGVDPRAKGAVVTSVRDGSPAQEAGVQQGDIIVEVDRKPVASPDDAVRALGADRQGGHLVRLRRGDVALFIVVPAA
jgi:serine protease Do